MEPKRLLITGIAGMVGSILVPGLRDSYRLRGLDVTLYNVDGVESVLADATDLDAIQPWFESVDCVLHLAGYASVDSPWDEVYRNNVPAASNVLEAARRAGVGRVILASSNHVTGMVEREKPYSQVVAGKYKGLKPERLDLVSPADPIRPDSHYAVGKAMTEAAGRYYAEAYGLSVIGLRFGTINRENRPTEPRHYATLLTHRDLMHLVQRCIEAPPELGYSIFYGVSNNRWRYWDIRNAIAHIGYKPQDNAESYR